MTTILTRTLAALELGPPRVYRHLVLFPLLGLPPAPARWTTLDAALAAGQLTITETSPAGHVPELQAHNTAPVPVLLLDGEELLGAKQNRVLNTTLLLRENSDTRLPVSCTEQGRWSAQSAAFAAANQVLARPARARKSASVSASLAAAAGFASDQGEVWAEIAQLQARSGTHSPTSALHDVFQALAPQLTRALTALPLVPGQSGLLVVIDGQVAGLDLVPPPELYGRLHAKLVRSYVLEALLETDPSPPVPDRALELARGFLGQLAGCDERAFPSIGYGTDHRYAGPGVAGAALVHADQVVHAAFFRLDESARQTDMASLRQRRRYRTPGQ